VRTLGIETPEIQSLGLDDGELARLGSMAGGAKDFDLNRLFRTLIKCLHDLDGSEMDRYISENYLLEWCFDPGLPSVEDLRKGQFLNHSHSLQKPTFQSPQTTSPPKSATSAAISSSRVSDQNLTNLKVDASKLNVTEKSSEVPVPSKAKLNVKSFAQGMREALADPIPKLDQVAEQTPSQKTALLTPNDESQPKPSIGSELVKKKSNLTETLSHTQNLKSGIIHPIDQTSDQLKVDTAISIKAATKTHMDEPSSFLEQPHQAPPKKWEAPHSSELGAPETPFPETWNKLVDLWKTTRPLEARKLEEVIPLLYSDSQIRLGVKVDSLMGKVLLQNDGAQKLKQDFRDLFSFKGDLFVDILTDETSGESLLKVKEREALERKEKLKNEALESPFVKHLSSAFGAQVLGVRVSESNA